MENLHEKAGLMARWGDSRAFPLQERMNVLRGLLLQRKNWARIYQTCAEYRKNYYAEKISQINHELKELLLL